MDDMAAGCDGVYSYISSIIVDVDMGTGISAFATATPTPGLMLSSMRSASTGTSSRATSEAQVYYLEQLRGGL